MTVTTVVNDTSPAVLCTAGLVVPFLPDDDRETY